MAVRRYPRGPLAQAESLDEIQVGVGAPVIGITAYSVDAAWGSWSGHTTLIPSAYVDGVLGAGGVPIVLPAAPGVMAAMIPLLDGLLIAGGPDVDPSRYGAERDPATQPSVPERDAAEAVAIEEAVAAGVPVLGVCRGMQVLNVVRGGTLTQHLPDTVGHHDHSPPGGDTFEGHPVTVASDSRLASILGEGLQKPVPTFHHQGVDALGSGLAATAWAEDGTIEALEDPSLAFCVGVQWHPEAGVDPRLFVALVEAARARRAG